MSADNGIYILKTRDGQYRVEHMMAVDNLWWSFETFDQTRELVPTRLVERYGQRYTKDFEKAMKIANIIKNRFPVVEYGIQILESNKTWKQIVYEAKRMAEREIKAIEIRGKEKEWKSDINVLQKIMMMK